MLLTEKEKRAIIDKKYYKNHREERLRKNKLWHEKNPEKVRECRRRYTKEIRKYVNNYKLSRGCSICGYNKCANALEFHHEENDKEFNVGSMVGSGYSLKMIKEEMDKCEVLCANCHRELHAKLRG